MATIASHGPLDLPQYNMAVVDSIRKMMINQEFLGQPYSKQTQLKKFLFQFTEKHGETNHSSDMFRHVLTILL